MLIHVFSHQIIKYSKVEEYISETVQKKVSSLPEGDGDEFLFNKHPFFC